MTLLGNDRPDCPDCSMRMISFDGVKYDKKTFERLRCGHIEQPKIAGRPISQPAFMRFAAHQSSSVSSVYPLAVDHPAVLCDRNVDAGTAIGVD
jgi:hypothetical protein